MAKPIDTHLLQHRQFVHNTSAGCDCDHYFKRLFPEKQRILIEYNKSANGARYKSNPYIFQHYKNGELQNSIIGIGTARLFDEWMISIGLLEEGIKTNEIG